MTKVEITETGYITLRILVRYMAAFIGEKAAIALGEKLLDTATNSLSSHPVRPICLALELLGVTDYRQLTLGEKYKILYRYDEIQDTVYIMGFMRQKQSAEQLLVQFLIQKDFP